MASTLLSDLEADGQKLESFISNVFNGGKKIVAAIEAVSPATKTVIVSLVNDVVKAATSASEAVAAAEEVNIPATITLSETTIAGIKQLIADAKAGEAVAVADLAALGIKL